MKGFNITIAPLEGEYTRILLGSYNILFDNFG